MFFVDDQVAVRTPVIAEETLEGHGDLPVSKSLSLAPRAVFRDAPALFLGQAGHDRQQQFALGIKGPYPFFFKIDLDAVLFQLPDGRQAVYGIPGEAADRLCDNQVDLPGQGVLDHAVKPIPLFRIAAGDPFVGVHGHKFPIIALSDVLCVVVHLGFIAALLFFVVRTYTGVCGHLALLPAGQRRSCKFADLRGYGDYAFSHVTVLPSAKRYSSLPSASTRTSSTCWAKASSSKLSVPIT